jgi:hypothetical protein
VLRKNAARPKRGPLFHQLKQEVFSLLTDCDQVLDVDHQFAMVQIRSGPLAHGSELSGPRRDQLSLQNQPALVAAIDDGDLQHVLSRTVPIKAKHMPNSHGRNSMIVQWGENLAVLES